MSFLVPAIAVSVWASLHSWLASTSVKEWMRRALGEGTPRVYRIAYNAFSALSLAPIALLMRNLPDHLIYRLSAPYSLLLLALQLASALSLLLAVLQTDVFHFVGWSQMLGKSSSSALITGGFYAVVRHPLYLFGLITMWLTPSMTLNHLAVYVVLTCYVFVGARLEERRLIQEYGDEYETYRSKVPMILPASISNPRGLASQR